MFLNEVRQLKRLEIGPDCQLNQEFFNRIASCFRFLSSLKLGKSDLVLDFKFTNKLDYLEEVCFSSKPSYEQFESFILFFTESRRSDLVLKISISNEIFIICCFFDSEPLIWKVREVNFRDASFDTNQINDVIYFFFPEKNPELVSSTATT